MTARRFFSAAGAIAVGLVAGLASYTHMRQLGIDTHQGNLIASIVPLSVDGLVLVATLAIGDGRKSRFTAWLAFLIGVGVSLAANVAAADPTTLARCWSAWPSAGFLLAIEVLIRGGRKAVEPSANLPKVDRARKLPQLREFADDVSVPGVHTYADAVAAINDAQRVRQLAHPTSDHAGTAVSAMPDTEVVSAMPYTRKPAAKPRSPRRDSNAERVAKAAARNPNATSAQLAVKLDLSDATVRRYLKSDQPGARTAERGDFVNVL